MRFMFEKNMIMSALSRKNMLNLFASKRFMSLFPSISSPIKRDQTNRDKVIKTMTKQDLAMALDWAKKESWNPAFRDHEVFYAADPLGYRMLWVDGKPIASLATVKYSDQYAFFGLYIVHPKFRSQGYGKLLWNFSAESVSACTTMALNGTLEQVETYKRSGFCRSNLNTRWSTNLFNSKVRNSPCKSTLTNTANLMDVVDLDYKSSSIYRPEFWKKLLSKPESFFLSLNEGGSMKGFGLVSRCVNGYKLGPVYASEQDVAEDVVIALWQHAQKVVCPSGGESLTIQLDTTELNANATHLTERLGFTKVFDTVRMYRGPKPDMDDSSTYGLATLEIG